MTTPPLPAADVEACVEAMRRFTGDVAADGCRYVQETWPADLCRQLLETIVEVQFSRGWAAPGTVREHERTEASWARVEADCAEAKGLFIDSTRIRRQQAEALAKAEAERDKAQLAAAAAHQETIAMRAERDEALSQLSALSSRLLALETDKDGHFAAVVDQRDEARAERDHWRANHDSQVARKHVAEEYRNAALARVAALEGALAKLEYAGRFVPVQGNDSGHVDVVRFKAALDHATATLASNASGASGEAARKTTND